MKTTVITTFGLVLFLFVSVQFSACGNANEESNTTEQKQDKKTEADITADGDKWMCPMKCEGDKYHDKPGDCSVCGMKLKKLE